MSYRMINSAGPYCGQFQCTICKATEWHNLHNEVIQKCACREGKNGWDEHVGRYIYTVIYADNRPAYWHLNGKHMPDAYYCDKEQP